MSSFEKDASSGVLQGELDLDSLSTGTYKCTVSLHISNGDELVARQFTFTK